MLVSENISEIRKRRWLKNGETWGLVPTMGFLHKGHLSLVRQAQQENDAVCVSIFVNPIQFNRKQDFDTYPVDMKKDLALLEKEGVDLVWTPKADQLYPRNFQTYVDVTQITQFLEGAARPGHFRGVTTIVAILFNVFQPTRAYFGQKDAQQVAVIRRMVEDLLFNLTIKTCPTMREADGLAMSSRNTNLTEDAREQAPVLYQTLAEARRLMEEGEESAVKIKQFMQEKIEQTSLALIDYISVADPVTLQELETIQGEALISLAVFFGEVRLIDNVVFSRNTQ
ncbi:MAG: pantoate--beta-alanine ligase [Deferribacteres bacterium]|nr:pantoate--beta-alanine ligase [candidate division KSB1 bacterium]MCB9501680.1 pantoate--beta-alanine ligase [Deferribacteres bacterium]